MKKEDTVKARWKQFKDRAVEFGTMAVDSMLKDYQEPIRAGTRRGDLIGFSRKKKRAAYFMILHNRHFGLGLKEIAKIAAVPHGVLLIWHTQPQFKREEVEACKMLGEAIANTIDNEWMEEIAKKWVKSEPYLRIKGVEGDRKDFLLAVLSFLNPLVKMPLIELIAERLEEDIPGYAGFALLMIMAEEVRDEKSLRRWKALPEMKGHVRAVIKSYINDISDPKVRKILGVEKFQEMVDEFKRFIFDELDLEDSK